MPDPRTYIKMDQINFLVLSLISVDKASFILLDNMDLSIGAKMDAAAVNNESFLSQEEYNNLESHIQSQVIYN